MYLVHHIDSTLILGIGETRDEALAEPLEASGGDHAGLVVRRCSITLADAAIEEAGETPWRIVDGVAVAAWEAV